MLKLWSTRLKRGRRWRETRETNIGESFKRRATNDVKYVAVRHNL